MEKFTDYSRFVVGYHGCDADLAQKVLLGEEDLIQSENKYDWLGKGVYFWENGPRRAYEFAVREAERKPSKVKKPAIIGAYLFLGQCFDLLDTQDTELLKEGFEMLKNTFMKQEKVLPTNDKKRTDGTKLFHALDCATINYTIEALSLIEGRTIQTVRGCFLEGGPIYPGAEIHQQSHIQIAVRDMKCIAGYFRPRNY
jgi:hypothetical protein